jgi:hypothetical protein
MNKIAFIGGVLCLLYVSLGILAGLLPVNLWTYILDLFVEREPGTFYKVVPTEGATYKIPLVTLVGIALIVLSRMKVKKEIN